MTGSDTPCPHCKRPQRCLTVAEGRALFEKECRSVSLPIHLMRPDEMVRLPKHWERLQTSFAPECGDRYAHDMFRHTVSALVLQAARHKAPKAYVVHGPGPDGVWSVIAAIPLCKLIGVENTIFDLFMARVPADIIEATPAPPGAHHYETDTGAIGGTDIDSLVHLHVQNLARAKRIYNPRFTLSGDNTAINIVLSCDYTESD